MTSPVAVLLTVGASGRVDETSDAESLTFTFEGRATHAAVVLQDAAGDYQVTAIGLSGVQHRDISLTEPTDRFVGFFDTHGLRSLTVRR
jgi:hypothetical protein